MTVEGLIIFLLIGAVAGWLAGVILKGGGFGLIGNIVAGIIGAFVGGWLFRELGISIGTGIVSTIITAAIGAIVVLLVVGLIRRAA
ncbi:MAG TPA: GlsB/YeaQ/YmgE family stress response membrane protein [Blastocatellia bacterium]|nr:GlsB/YeaQ/YmgE family stress response membrane protein [Blastocatellia bacterium]